jgi:hypothetical protein
VIDEACYSRELHLKVYETFETLKDGKEWQHISISHPSRYPTWDEIMFVKDHFTGEGQEAVMVLPKHSEFVNIHEFCFQYYSCTDGDSIPK